jgi:hypothetical protein
VVSVSTDRKHLAQPSSTTVMAGGQRRKSAAVAARASLFHLNSYLAAGLGHANAQSHDPGSILVYPVIGRGRARRITLTDNSVAGTDALANASSRPKPADNTRFRGVAKKREQGPGRSIQLLPVALTVFEWRRR